MHKSHTLPGQISVHHRPRSASSHSQESRSSYERSTSPHKPGHSKHAKSKKQKSPVDKQKSPVDKYQYAENQCYQHSVPNNTSINNNQDPRHYLDARPKIQLANHNLFHGSGQAMETCLDEVPTDYPDSSFYRGDDQSNDAQQIYPTEYLGAEDATQGQAQPNQRKSRVFRKYREMHCASFPNSDIGIEYNVRMPRKHSRMSQSRDSGVNCVVLTDKHTGQPTVPPLQNHLAHLEQHDNRSPVNHWLSTHEAQIHSIPEHVHEDSGFNSPRTAELPPAGQANPYYTHDNTFRTEVTPVQGKLNTDSRASSQSPPLEGSDLYPPTGCIQSSNLHHQPMYGSSSWSSSVQTVREMPVAPSRDQQVLPSSDYKSHRSVSSPPQLDLEQSALRQMVIRQEPYTEIHLVPEPRKHSHGKHKDRSRDRSPKRLSGGHKEFQQLPLRETSPSRGAKHGHSSGRRNLKDYGNNKHPDWDLHQQQTQQPQYYQRADYEVVGVV